MNSPEWECDSERGVRRLAQALRHGYRVFDAQLEKLQQISLDAFSARSVRGTGGVEADSVINCHFNTMPYAQRFFWGIT